MRKKHSIQLENIEVLDMVAEGKCIARHEGKVIFIKDVAPGDIVNLQVTRKKKSYMEAYATEVIKYSPLRTDPFCQHFWTCGGCKWQHIDYDAQTKFKQQQVVDALERIGKLELPVVTPILHSAETKFYRNKLEFTFSNNRWLTKEEIETEEDLQRNALGFHIPGRFDKILDIETCYLQPEPSNQIRNKLKDFALLNEISFFDLREQVGLLRNLVIRTTTTGELMVILQVAFEDVPKIHACLDFLLEEFPIITSLNYVINTKRNDTFGDLHVHHYHGKPYIEEAMEDLIFRIGPKSFYQTNPDQAYELYKIVRDYAGLTGEETVYDLYTGTGTIALFVAGNAGKVIGLEYVEEAISDAKLNAEANEISNADFYAGDMKDILTEAFVEQNGRPDVVITDPPRAGMHEDVVNQILLASPKRIVYVSCNPATQARDIALMKDKYKVVKVQPVDMFPHTYHVENVVLLEII